MHLYKIIEATTIYDTLFVLNTDGRSCEIQLLQGNMWVVDEKGNKFKITPVNSVLAIRGNVRLISDTVGATWQAMIFDDNKAVS